MKLSLIDLPVKDLDSALALDRDALGLEVACYAAFDDASGNRVHLLDLSAER